MTNRNNNKIYTINALDVVKIALSIYIPNLMEMKLNYQHNNDNISKLIKLPGDIAKYQDRI